MSSTSQQRTAEKPEVGVVQACSCTHFDLLKVEGVLPNQDRFNFCSLHTRGVCEDEPQGIDRCIQRNPRCDTWADSGI